MSPTNEAAEEWARRVTARLVSVGQEIIAQGWEDWARESAQDDHLPRGLVELMLKGDQGSIDAVARELHGSPSDLNKLAEWLRSLIPDWSSVFDRGWLRWKLSEDLLVPEPQPGGTQSTPQNVHAAPTDASRLQTVKDLLEEKTAGYGPSTELSRIVWELTHPSGDLPPSPEGLVEVPNPFDVERRKWLPILQDCIGKIPELAENLTEAKLRQWLWSKYKVPPTQDLNAEQLVRLLEREQGDRPVDQPAERPTEEKAGPPTKKAKRSTERGGGRVKIIAALTEHHQYANGGCLNLEPIGNNELARKADVSESTVSAFFQKEFKGHIKYRAACNDATRLAASLKMLNGEFSPHILFGRSLPGEGQPDDE
jgi:hypothetical protein